jgi:hypothetical protein
MLLTAQGISSGTEAEIAEVADVISDALDAVLGS